MMLSKNVILFPLFLLSIPSGRAKSSLTKTEAFSALQIVQKNKLFSKPHSRNPFNTPPDLPSLPSNESKSLSTTETTTKRSSTNTHTAFTTRLFSESRGGDTSSPISFKKKLIAEAIGTFIIVHLGCGTVCSLIFKSAQQGLWQVAAVWSLAVTVAIYTTAGISGAHLNPAISVAMKVCRPSDHKDMGWGKVAGYCAAQTLGAVIAAAANLGLYWESIMQYEAANGIVKGAANSVASAAAFGEYWSVSTWQQAFLAETMGTFMLAFIIFSLTNPQNDAVPDKLAPGLIGGTVGCLISIIAPLTQAGFNPARDFGPRIVAWLAGWKGIAFQGWWVYVLGPLLGAVLGGLFAEKVLWT